MDQNLPDDDTDFELPPAPAQDADEDRPDQLVGDPVDPAEGDEDES